MFVQLPNVYRRTWNINCTEINTRINECTLYTVDLCLIKPRQEVRAILAAHSEARSTEQSYCLHTIGWNHWRTSLYRYGKDDLRTNIFKSSLPCYPTTCYCWLQQYEERTNIVHRVLFYICCSQKKTITVQRVQHKRDESLRQRMREHKVWKIINILFYLFYAHVDICLFHMLQWILYKAYLVVSLYLFD